MTIIKKSKVYATERVYTDAGRTGLFKEGDPKAAILVAPKDGEIPDRLVEKFGLLKESPASPPAGSETIAARKTRVPGPLKERA